MLCLAASPFTSWSVACLDNRWIDCLWSWYHLRPTTFLIELTFAQAKLVHVGLPRSEQTRVTDGPVGNQVNLHGSPLMDTAVYISVLPRSQRRLRQNSATPALADIAKAGAAWAHAWCLEVSV